MVEDDDAFEIVGKPEVEAEIQQVEDDFEEVEAEPQGDNDDFVITDGDPETPKTDQESLTEEKDQVPTLEPLLLQISKVFTPSRSPSTTGAPTPDPTKTPATPSPPARPK